MHLATTLRLASGWASAALKGGPAATAAAAARASAPKLHPSSAAPPLLRHSQGLSTRAEQKQERLERRYHWIEPEAERLIARAYARHKTLQQRDQPSPNGWTSIPPSISLKDLESAAIEKE